MCLTHDSCSQFLAKVTDGKSKTFGKSKKNKKNPWFSAKATPVFLAPSPLLWRFSWLLPRYIRSPWNISSPSAP